MKAQTRVSLPISRALKALPADLALVRQGDLPEIIGPEVLDSIINWATEEKVLIRQGPEDPTHRGPAVKAVRAVFPGPVVLGLRLLQPDLLKEKARRKNPSRLKNLFIPEKKKNWKWRKNSSRQRKKLPR
jgi:hypothetical protein